MIIYQKGIVNVQIGFKLKYYTNDARIV